MNDHDNLADDSGTPITSNFQLVNHLGKTVTHRDFLEQYMLVYFGFTFCPDVCPRTLQIIIQAYENLPKNIQKQINIVFISVDPERDTVDVMAEYVTFFHEDLVGLTGTPEQVAAAAKAFGIYYKKNTKSSSVALYLVDHSTITYLIDPEGRYVQHFGHGTKAEELLSDMLKEIENKHRQ